MKSWMRRSLRIIISVTALVTVFLTVSHVTAVDDSAWVNSGAITRTLIAESITGTNGPYFDSFCNRLPLNENKYAWRGNGWVKDGVTDIEGGCWTTTNYGLFGAARNGSYLRIGQAGVAAKINSNYGMYMPLPGSDKLARRDNTNSSFYWGLSIFDNINATSMSKTTMGGRDIYDPPSNANRWVARDSNTGNALQINRVDVSANGKWLVVEGAGAFFRLNVETKEILSFQAPINLYGYGLNPSYNLAISNDGRYATIAVGGNNSGKFLLYDLATCVSNPAQIMKPATGCGKRDIRPDAMPGAPYSAVPMNVEFSNSGEGISYNHYENGKVNRFMITAPGKSEHLLEYLALGDSFSSGEGDNDGGRYYAAGTDGNGEAINNTGIENFPYWREKCHLSARSYPYLLANEADIASFQFRSVACSGADLNDLLNLKSTGPIEERFNGHFDHMEDLFPAQLSEVKYHALNNFIPGRTAQIEFVQKYKPRAVTIGIGGNDIDFGQKLSECLLPGTCRYAGADKKYTAIEIFLLYDKLVKAYTQLKSASPTSRFYAVGYPQLFTSGGECQKNVFFDETEREYATYVVNYLNHTIAAAAARAGIDYIRIEDSLAGNNLCSSADNLAVNGLETGSDKSLLGHDSRYFGIFGAESYHPNNIGHSLIANALRIEMGYSPINTFNTCFPGIGLSCNTASSSKPTPPAYFGLESNFSPVVRGRIQIENNNSEIPDDSVQKGTEVSVGMSSEEVLKPGSIANFTLHSDPVNLGQAIVDALGKISADLEIPVNTPPGYHTLHVAGTTPADDSIDYYQSIFVYANVDDFDGDGISNADDTCGLVEPANIDIDADGIDDACDGFIGEVETHPLYRVRPGDTDKGEIASRFYIERDILEAKSKLGIVNDTDPDGDGWALVGHTESDNDGKTQTQFWVDSENVPHLLLDGENSVTCMLLTPVTLTVVVQGEDRLLQAEQGSSCPSSESMQMPGAVVPTPGVGESVSLVTELAGNNNVLGITIVNPQLAVSLATPDQLQPALALGATTEVLTAGVPHYFDGAGKNSTDIVREVSSTLFVVGSIMLTTALGVVLIHSVTSFSKNL